MRESGGSSVAQRFGSFVCTVRAMAISTMVSQCSTSQARTSA